MALSECKRGDLLHGLNKFGEDSRVLHSHLRENLTVEGDIFFFHEGDKLGVGHAVLAEGIVETNNPEGTERALFGATIAASVLPSLNNSFLGLGKEFLTAPAIAFGLFENILVAFFGHYAALDSSHTEKDC